MTAIRGRLDKATMVIAASDTTARARFGLDAPSFLAVFTSAVSGFRIHVLNASIGGIVYGIYRARTQKKS